LTDRRKRPAPRPKPWTPALRLRLRRSPEGESLVDRLHAAAGTDPHFARRATLAAHTGPAPTTLAILERLRSDRDDPAWTGILADLAIHLATILPALSGPVDSADPEATARAIGALHPAEAEFATARFMRLAGHFAALGAPVPGPPLRRWPRTGSAIAPWRPEPDPLPGPVIGDWLVFRAGHLAATNLLADGAAESVEALSLAAEDPAWDAFRARAAAGALPDPRDGWERETAHLVRIGDASPCAGLAVRARADRSRGVLWIDLDGPHEIPGTGSEAAVPYLAHLAAASVLAALPAWDRLVAPDGRLRLVASPPPGPSADPFVQDVIDAVATTFALSEEEAPIHGYDLVATRCGPDGAPAPLPALHRTICPPAAGAGWADLVDSLSVLRLSNGEPVLLRAGSPDPVPTAMDGSALPEGGDADPLAAEGANEALALVLAEAGLGEDALVLSGDGYLAVAAADAWDGHEADIGRSVALVVPPGPIREGEWERMRSAFWRDHHDRHQALLAAREADGTASSPRPGRLH
jgi:hypothetical protein